MITATELALHTVRTRNEDVISKIEKEIIKIADNGSMSAIIKKVEVDVRFYFMYYGYKFVPIDHEKEKIEWSIDMRK